MSTQDATFDPISFFNEYQASIENYRNNNQGLESLKPRDIEDYKSTIDIYNNYLLNRIKSSCEYLSLNNNHNSVNNDEKTQILGQYFQTHPRPQIHVIQGPPGTGKTELSAIYILLYLLEWHIHKSENSKEKPIIVVSAFTHKAIDNLLLRIERLFPLFYALALHKEHIPKCACAQCLTTDSHGSKKVCDEDFTPFARMIKLHSQSRRSDFNGNEGHGYEEKPDYAPDLVFSNRNDVPTDDAKHPLGIHDMRVNWQNFEWFLPSEKECCPPNHTCEFTKEDDFKSSTCRSEVCLLKRIQSFDRATIIGTTTSQLIKLKKMGDEGVQDLKADFLLLDEASMMMLPDFLPIADRVKKGGHMVVVGDDLQLGPISQNNWSQEIRPSLNEEKPWNSVFHYLRRKADPKKATSSENVTFSCCRENIAWAALQTTYRLTAEAAKLIQHAYDRVDVTLKPKDNGEGNDFHLVTYNRCGDVPLEFKFYKNSKDKLQEPSHKVTLITYKNEEAGTENVHERGIIKKLLEQNLIPISQSNQKKKDIKQSVAIVTPYRDQINKLKLELGQQLFKDGKVPSWLLIDTVNKLQGDEREVIIFSACVAGTENLLTHGSFVMELQRTIVAFSRAKKQLIVIASESLLNYIPSGFEEYHAALLWKKLRDLPSSLNKCFFNQINDFEAQKDEQDELRKIIEKILTGSTKSIAIENNKVHANEIIQYDTLENKYFVSKKDIDELFKKLGAYSNINCVYESLKIKENPMHNYKLNSIKSDQVEGDIDTSAFDDNDNDNDNDLSKQFQSTISQLIEIVTKKNKNGRIIWKAKIIDGLSHQNGTVCSDLPQNTKIGDKFHAVVKSDAPHNNNYCALKPENTE